VEQRRRFASSGNLDARNVDRPNPPIAARIRGFGGHEERRMNRITTAVACSILTLAAASGTCLAQEQDERSNIVEVAAKAGNFHTLIAAAKAAGLAETLMGKGPLTVFAPTDEAFAKLGKDKIAELLKPENKDQLAAILKYHVVAGAVPAKKVVGMKAAKSVAGSELPIAVKDGTVHVANATVVKTDIAASNGVIHVVDAVMMPPTKPNLVAAAKQAGAFGTLLKAAQAAGLAETLAQKGPFTIFAPTDEAFAKLGKDKIAELLKPENKDQLAAILKYHVVAGTVPSKKAVELTETATLNGAKLSLKFDGKTLHVGTSKVIQADVEASNGVIHVIDSVLLPR